MTVFHLSFGAWSSGYSIFFHSVLLGLKTHRNVMFIENPPGFLRHIGDNTDLFFFFFLILFLVFLLDFGAILTKFI